MFTSFLLLGVRAEVLWANIGSKLKISLQQGPVDPKFQVERVATTNHSSSQKTRLNDLSYGIKFWTDLSSVLSQCMRLTDRQTEFSSLDHVCIPCNATKMRPRRQLTRLCVQRQLYVPVTVAAACPTAALLPRPNDSWRARPSAVMPCAPTHGDTLLNSLLQSYHVTTSIKSTRVARGNFTPTHTLYPWSGVNFGIWGRVLDEINHAKFQLNRFRGFGAPGGRKSLSPIDWRYRPYNSVRTNVLHCDNAITLTTCTVKRYRLSVPNGELMSGGLKRDIPCGPWVKSAHLSNTPTITIQY